MAAFVFAAGSADGGVELGCAVFEGAAGVALVGDDGQVSRRDRTRASKARQTSRSEAFGEVSCRARGVPSRREQGVQPEAPEVAAVACAVAVVGRVGQLAAPASSRCCGRTRPGSSRPARGRRGSQGSRTRTRRSAPRSCRPSGRGACGSQTAWAAAGTDARGVCAPPRRNRSSEGIPISACATQSVTTSASVRFRLAFFVCAGRRSSAAQNTAISNRSRSAGSWPPWVDGANRHRRLRPDCCWSLQHGQSRGTTH